MKETPLSPTLNYITLQHKQRLRYERLQNNIIMKHNNLNKTFEKHIDSTVSTSSSNSNNNENQSPSLLNKSPIEGGSSKKINKSPIDTIIKTNKSPSEGGITRLPLRRIQPVQVDEGTLDLVAALMKPRHRRTEASSTCTTTTYSASSIATNANNTTTTSSTVTDSSSNIPTNIQSFTVYKDKTEEASTTSNVCTNNDGIHNATTVSATKEIHTTINTTPMLTDHVVVVPVTTSVEERESVVSETSQMMACDEPISEFADIDTITTSPVVEGRNSNERKRKHSRGSGTSSSIATGSGMIVTVESPEQVGCLNSSRYITRRGTLSPASVRAMLMEACEDTLQSEEQEEDDCTTTGISTASTTTTAVTSPLQECNQEYTESIDVNSASTTHGMYFPSPEQHLYRLESTTTTSDITTTDTTITTAAPTTSTAEVVLEYAELGSPLSTEGNKKKHARAGSPSTSALFAADALCEMAVSTDYITTTTIEETTLYSDEHVEVSSTETVVEISEISEDNQEGIHETTTEISEEDHMKQSISVQEGQITEESVEVEVLSLVAMEEEEGYSGSNDNNSSSNGCDAIDTEMNVSVALTSAEMEVIASFGRELDSLLCDVHTTTSTTAEVSHSAANPSDNLIEDDDELMCFSPTVTAEPAWRSQPRRMSMQGVPSYPYSRRRSSMSFAAPNLEEAENDTVVEVSERVVLHTHSPGAGEGVCAISPTRAADLSRSPLPSEPVREICTAPAEAVAAMLTSNSPLGYTGSSLLTSSSSPGYAETLSGNTVCPTPSPHKPLSAISPLRSPLTGLREVIQSRAQTPTGSSPASSYCDQHDTPQCSITTPHSTGSATSTPRSRHILSPTVCEEGNLSMDVSQLIYQTHDADLDDFEMLENLVQQEFQSGELQWDFKLPPVPGLHSSTVAVDVTRLEDAVDIMNNMLNGSTHSNSSCSSSTAVQPLLLQQLREGEDNSNTGNTTPALTTSGNTTTASSTSSSSIVYDNIPPLQDIAVVEAQAKARFEEKLKIARWQYEWEVVSAHMANTAIQRLNKNKM